MREKDIEARLLRAVAKRGGHTRKVQWIGRRGCPDRLVMLPGGRSLWVELKAPWGRLSPHQMREHEVMRAMGLDVRVVASVADIEDALNV